MRDYCHSFYKGPVAADDRQGIALLSRRDPSTGLEISRERYVELVHTVTTSRRHPALIANIARAMAAAVLASHENARGGDFRLVGGDGCSQSMEGRPCNGADVLRRIWDDIVPPALVSQAGGYDLQAASVCTLEEVRAIRALFRLAKGSQLLAVTHGYHAARAALIWTEELPRDVTFQGIRQPVDALQITGTALSPDQAFAQDVIRAAVPPEDGDRNEYRKECCLYGPLHALSRNLEHMFGESLEVWLAATMRTTSRSML